MNRYAVTAQEMRMLEQAAFDQGVPPLLLMENAARHVAAALFALPDHKKAHKAIFLCGPGNNGGDGIAAARLFCEMGGEAVICLAAAPKTESAKANLAYAKYLGIPVTDTLPDAAPFDACVDALLGIGQSRAPEGAIADAVQWMNDAGIPIVSADVPTGMDSDTGHVFDPCVRADVTVTFHKAKLGLMLTDHLDFVGDLRVAPIGLSNDDTGIPYYGADTLPQLLPPRSRNVHKGSCGRVLVYAGSTGKAGAAAMCALGALKAGAGLVTIACPADIIPTLQVLVPNAMCVPVEMADQIPFDVLAAGCGIGTDENARMHLERLIKKADRCVLDADALNLLAASPFPVPKGCVLTPHPLECARLLDMPLTDMLASPIGCAKALAAKYHCTCVVKNAVSVIADSERIALNTVGAPCLAKGGSGDALCGILSACLWEMKDPFESTRCACLRMGDAAQRAQADQGDRGVLTADWLRYLK